MWFWIMVSMNMTNLMTYLLGTKRFKVGASDKLKSFTVKTNFDIEFCALPLNQYEWAVYSFCPFGGKKMPFPNLTPTFNLNMRCFWKLPAFLHAANCVEKLTNYIFVIIFLKLVNIVDSYVPSPSVVERVKKKRTLFLLLRAFAKNDRTKRAAGSYSITLAYCMH